MTSTRIKHLDAAITKLDAGAARRITFRASQEIVDRQGEVILARGIERRDFDRNPVFLGDHDPTFPLGRIVRHWIEDESAGPSLMMTAEILPAGTSPRVDEAWAAMTFGARNGISIGFQPLEYDRVPVRPGQTGITFRRVRLLEVSSVSLPACETCVITAKRAPSACASRGATNLDVTPSEVAAVMATVAREQVARVLARRIGAGEILSERVGADGRRHVVLDGDAAEVTEAEVREVLATLAEQAAHQVVCRLTGRVD